MWSVRYWSRQSLVYTACGALGTLWLIQVMIRHETLVLLYMFWLIASFDLLELFFANLRKIYIRLHIKTQEQNGSFIPKEEVRYGLKFLQDIPCIVQSNMLQVFSVPLAPWASASSYCWQTTHSLSFRPWVLPSVQPTRSTRMPWIGSRLLLCLRNSATWSCVTASLNISRIVTLSSLDWTAMLLARPVCDIRCIRFNK